MYAEFMKPLFAQVAHDLGQRGARTQAPDRLLRGTAGLSLRPLLCCLCLVDWHQTVRRFRSRTHTGSGIGFPLPIFA